MWLRARLQWLQECQRYCFPPSPCHSSPIPHTRHRDRDVAALLSAETSQHQWCSLAGPAPRCWGSTGPACAQVSDRVLQPVP